MYETLISESVTQINKGKKDYSFYSFRKNWLIIYRNIMLYFYSASYTNGSSSLRKLSVKNLNYQIIEDNVRAYLDDISR